MNCVLLNETVYPDLKIVARRLFARERPGHTLQPEALLHEALLRLAMDEEHRWTETAHFKAAASLRMRQILIDHGRRRRAAKHGSDLRVSLDYALNIAFVPPAHPDLTDALRRLRRDFPLAAHVVELKFFSGMTDPEMAAALKCSPRTVRRHWQFARVWLRDRVGVR